MILVTKAKLDIHYTFFFDSVSAVITKVSAVIRKVIK